MSAYPQSVIKLINEFGKMPGIGQKTAERLACYILKLPAEEAMLLAYAIRDVKSLPRYARSVLMFRNMIPVIFVVMCRVTNQ